MDDALTLDPAVSQRRWARIRKGLRACAPTRVEVGLSILSAALLIISFPNFGLWPLAWVGLVPLFVAVVRRPHRGPAFLLGWITGTLFFYGSCYWLTYAMIRYGEIPTWIAYLLLIPGPLIAGLFPALCCMTLARAAARWGARAVFLAPVLWAAFEWARLGTIGQLWNAIGYSQAFEPVLIQAARWGGVYLVGFLVVAVNTALAYVFLQRNARALKISAAAVLCVLTVTLLSLARTAMTKSDIRKPEALIVAVQPNVPMDPQQSLAETAELIQRHYLLSERGLSEAHQFGDLPRVVIWPESPMNFKYAGDRAFQELIANFAVKNHVSVLFNSQEPAPAGGTYNSAVMVNEDGRLVAQYDKIRLLPFGEYVPLPRWLPGVSSIPAMVGDFTPGARYTLMPLGDARIGVFICFESAFPYIARAFAQQGADVLVNISNDGYLGPTAVMQQHLANTVFRAVENGRPVLRVTNTGISAFVTEHGVVLDATPGFQPDVRVWPVYRARNGRTFYTKYGDLFVGLCAVMTLLVIAFSWRRTRQP